MFEARVAAMHVMDRQKYFSTVSSVDDDSVYETKRRLH